MKNRLRSAQSAFSLVELLIAGVIIAMTGSLLIGGLISANRSGELRVQQAIAAQLAASQLALIDEQVAPDSPNKGAFPEPYQDSTWILEQQDTPIPTVKRLQLTVSYQGHDFHVATYRRLKDPQS